MLSFIAVALWRMQAAAGGKFSYKNSGKVKRMPNNGKIHF